MSKLFELEIIDNVYDISLGNAAETHWLEGSDDISYADVVGRLIAEGRIPKAPYNLPMPYLSVSQVEQYLKCPQQYEFRYIKGQKSPPGAAMIQGTNIHESVEGGYNHLIDTKELPPLEMALDLYNDAAQKRFTKDLQYDEGEDVKFLRKQGETLITEWHTNKLPTVRPIAVEKQFVTPVAGIPVVGAIDLIERTGDFESESVTEYHEHNDTVVDNKVTKSAWSQNEVDSALQMSLYSKATGLRRQRYDFFVKGNPEALRNPKSRSKGPHLTEIATSRSIRDIEWMAEIFEKVAKAISAGVFPPTAPDSWTCNRKWCGYWSQCRGKNE